MKKITVAIQILPQKDGLNYEIIDSVIDKIKQSGLNYLVCPFETVVEGYWDEISDLIKDIHEYCYELGAGSVVANFKIHSHKDKDTLIKEKLAKYPNQK